MPDIILEYEMLEAVAEYSISLRKRAEQYADSLEYKLLSGLEGVTGSSSSYLESAADSVRAKIKLLKQKSESFYLFAEQITNLLETAERMDQEVADAITAQSINFVEHNESLRLDNWKLLLQSLLIKVEKGTGLLETLSDLLKVLTTPSDSLGVAIKHWYEGEEGRQVTLTANIPTPGIPLYDLFGFEAEGKDIFSLYNGDTFWILKYGAFNYSGLNYSTKNGKVDLKCNIKQEYTASKDSSVWSVTGNFFGGLWDGVKDSALGLVDSIYHYDKTLDSLNTVIHHPIKTGEAVATEVSNTFVDKVINGTPDTQAHYIGNVLSMVLMSVIGTKGIDKAAKFIKANNAAKLAEAAKVVGEIEDTSSDLNKVNNALNKAETSIDDAIKDIDESVGLNKDIEAGDVDAQGSGSDVKGGSEAVKDGATRAAKYSSEWENASLDDAINKFAPNAEPVVTSKGKVIYNNPDTGISVVYDSKGNYFRIEDTTKPRGRNYLDMDGNDMNNVTIDGKTSGRSKSDYQKATHFNNTDK